MAPNPNPNPNPIPPPPVVSARTKPYIEALQRLSARTRTPLSSLVVSFGIIHELTAILPVVGVFYAARAIGAGDRLVATLGDNDYPTPGWIKEWTREGEDWAGRIGRRYGVFGYTKGEPKQDRAEHSHHLAGDVANAVVAYGVVKVNIFTFLNPSFQVVH